MQFTIDRSKWRCGTLGAYRQGGGETALLNSEGYQCCLGFICEQLGINHHKMLNKAFPLEVTGDNLLTVDASFKSANTQFTDSAIEINDTEWIDSSERERRLEMLCGIWGHELVFQGEYENKES